MDNKSRIAVIGSGGAHFRKLESLKVFNNLDLFKVNLSSKLMGDEEGVIVAVNISNTKRVNEEIRSRVKKVLILNLCGIMDSTPDDLRDGLVNGQGIVNFHYMFGKKARPKKKKRLKCTYSLNGIESPIIQKLLKKTKKRGIIPHEVGIDQHDKAVAITQGLANLYVLLAGLTNQENSHGLINEWKTPENTIADMILCNPRFLEIYTNDLLDLKEGNSVSELFLEFFNGLSDSDSEVFATPNCDRVEEHAKNTGLIVDSNMMQCLDFLLNRYELIQSIIYVKNMQGTKN